MALWLYRVWPIYYLLPLSTTYRLQAAAGDQGHTDDSDLIDMFLCNKVALLLEGYQLSSLFPSYNQTSEIIEAKPLS